MLADRFLMAYLSNIGSGQSSSGRQTRRLMTSLIHLVSAELASPDGYVHTKPKANAPFTARKHMDQRRNSRVKIPNM